MEKFRPPGAETGSRGEATFWGWSSYTPRRVPMWLQSAASHSSLALNTSVMKSDAEAVRFSYQVAAETICSVANMVTARKKRFVLTSPTLPCTCAMAVGSGPGDLQATLREFVWVCHLASHGMSFTR